MLLEQDAHDYKHLSYQKESTLKLLNQIMIELTETL